MRLPDQLRRNALVLCSATGPGGRDWKPEGTGFLLSERVAGGVVSHRWCGYLVTARHVARRRTLSLALHYGLRDGGAPLALDPNRWFHHPSADISVYPLTPDDHQDEWPEPFPALDLATRDLVPSEAIGLGDEIGSVGYFPWSHRMDITLPVLRSGWLSAVPPVPFEQAIGEGTIRENITAEFIIAELNNVPGASGSPVYALPATDPPENARLRLIGLLSTEYRKPDRNATERVASITPAWIIREALDNKEFQEQRARLREDWDSRQTRIRG